MPAARHARTPLVLVALAALVAPSEGRAEEAAAARSCPQDFASVVLAKGVDLCARTIRETSRGNYEAEGAVTLRAEGVRLQAERLAVASQRLVTAEGDVLVTWEGNRISGARMTYDLEAGVGDVQDAVGQVVSEGTELFFSANEARKIGPDRVELKTATMTTCTQPVPHWSFAVSTAKVRLDHYARMWNVRLRAKKLPFFYLPFLVWPVKSERSAGLLFPNFGSTQYRGYVFSEAVFIPLGRSADLTLVGEAYTKSGWGAGLRFRARPSERGEILASGSYIYDDIAPILYPGGEIGPNRWRYTYKQTQDFVNGFRLVADVNEVSDSQFFSDFERELQLVSSPSVQTRVEMARNGSWTSINVRELRRKQFFGVASEDTLIQETLPEIEWRGRSRRIGRSPVYVAFTSSFASIRQRQGDAIFSYLRGDGASYLRGDVFPELSLPWSPTPWLDITPKIGVRTTYWSERTELFGDPSKPDKRLVSDGIARNVFGGGLEIVGPKIFRIFERPESRFSPRYKHSVEARIAYRYQKGYDRTSEIISYDEIDSIITGANEVSYGIATRLFAQRPRSAMPRQSPGSGVLLSGESTIPGDPGADAAPKTAEVREPVEIAFLEVRQSHDFDAKPGERSTGDIFVTGRFNPSSSTSVDLRTVYDIRRNLASSAALSGNFSFARPETGTPVPGAVREELARLSLSLVQNRNPFRSTSLNLRSYFRFWNSKVRFAFEGTYNPTAPPDSSHLPDQRWRIEYWTQCCGFLFEYLSRDYTQARRQDFHFTVDLRGIGKLIDPQWSTQETSSP